MALTKISGSILKDPLNLGEVSIGGTLTYQDVTNVDALGVGTFRTGINVSGGQLDVGSNIKIGNAGVITATNFSGSGASLTNLPAGNLTGTLPAIDGSNLTGVSGFSTAMSSTPNTFLNDCFKTTFSHTIPNGTQIDITNNETTSGKTVFTRLGQIKVATGATFHVSAGTTFVMDVLGVF